MVGNILYRCSTAPLLLAVYCLYNNIVNIPVEFIGLVQPEALAESYWALHQQPRTAWTHELDLRPWCEKW